jgi:phospholipid-binding lipoprotein MlaA
MATSFAFAFAFASAQPMPEPAIGLAEPVEVLADTPVAETGATALDTVIPTPPPGPEVSSPEVALPDETTPDPTLADPAPADPAAANATPADDLALDEIKLPSDPLEFFNRPSFAVSMAIDKVLIRPAALAYRAIVPKPARDGARNVLTNIREPLVFANDILQLRPKRAIRTLGRFLINTLIGVGGLFDLAKRKPFNLPHRDNSVGDTLGYYGIGPGPYLYIPVLGPTTFRDLAGQYADGYSHPRLLGNIVHPNKNTSVLANRIDFGPLGTPMTIVSGLDQRERNDDELNALLNDSIDKYATFRSSFLQDRQGEIEALKAKDGEAPATAGMDDPLVDPAAAAPEAPPESAQ